MKAAFTADGRQVLLATTQGTLTVKAVEDLPKLLERGCKELRSFLASQPQDDAVHRRLSFCGKR